MLALELAGQGARVAVGYSSDARAAAETVATIAAAGTQPVLWEAFDQLIGAGRWWRRRGQRRYRTVALSRPEG